MTRLIRVKTPMYAFAYGECYLHQLDSAITCYTEQAQVRRLTWLSSKHLQTMENLCFEKCLG